MLLVLLVNIEWWHWLVLAMLLMIVELVAPTTYFLCVAVAAFVVSMIVLVMGDITWEIQVALFGLLSVASLFAGYAWLKKRPIPSDEPQLNRRAEQYLGRTFTLTEAISNGYGTVQVDDTRWRVAGPELPVGQTVRVVDVDGTSFHVEAAD